MSKLLALNDLRWYVRLPTKWAIFGLALLAVCFPNPSLLVRHIGHWCDPNALIEPDAPLLSPLVQELRDHLSDEPTTREALQRVERFVHRKIPYEWDWNTWGAADYLPTVSETLEMGKEDCDGRAVIAASLLRNLGYDAHLVSDFAHVWVKTDQGELMGPGKSKAVTATEKGLRLDISALAELPRSAAYGLAVFPMPRELIVLAVAWLLLLHRGAGAVRSLAALSLLVASLMLLRLGGSEYRSPVVWLQWAGVAGTVAGVVAMYGSSPRGVPGTDRSEQHV